MPSWQKKTLFILGIITLASYGTGYYFHQNDSKFRYWWGLPLENRLLSVNLEVQRPFRHFLNGQIEPESYQALTVDSLKSLVASGANWIVNMQETSGRFNYWQNPEEKQKSPKRLQEFSEQTPT